MATLDFWYDLASTYSYPAAMRVEAEAAAANVDVRWRPFLVGGVFKALGWPDAPFNLSPTKGRYMWRDLERTCAALGLPFNRPDPFPQQSLLGMRVALIAHDEGWGPAFAKRAYRAEFGEGRNIGEPETVAAIIDELGQDSASVLARAESPDNKTRLRTETDEAIGLGIFGAPSMVTESGELFWGNDRLDQAITAAR
jgi:2-hydroxychromene-2-carboxylate isomerase